MELKQNNGFYENDKIKGFNRTFMELELISLKDLSLPSSVLIAPLWN